MNLGLKILLYVICAGLAVVFGWRFTQGFSARMEAGAQRFDQVIAPADAEPPAAEDSRVAPDAAATGSTNAAGNPSLDAIPGGTNTATSAASTNRPPLRPAPAAAPVPAARATGSSLGWDAALALTGVLGLALLIARDLSHYAAVRTHQFMYNEEGKGIGDPLYEQAEQTWANGNHLEAVRLLREYVTRNPRELHARLRIAEIYEKDLNNPLAAALEYEEILKTRFEAERWGWSAIHLCNLYARLNQEAKMGEWMQRVVHEVPHTAAARKASEKLGLPEDHQPTAATEPAAPENSAGGLPPGFRPKKG
jgi:hypothetical protein